MSYIFISYCHKDIDYVRELAATLRNERFSVWIDENIDYGEQWHKILQERIDCCGAFIVVMSSHAFNSEWVQNELGRALDRHKRVFPLLLEGDGTWLSVQTRQYIDVRNRQLPPPRFFERLAEVVPRQENGKTITIVEELIHQIKNGTDLERIEAARALRSLGAISALPELIELMSYYPERSQETIPVRNAARDAILELGWLFPSDVKQSMQQMLEDGKRHRYIRRRAIYILCKLEAKESLETMKSLVQDPDTQLRYKMADALKYFKNDQDAISILQHLRNDPIKEVRKRAQATLDEMVDK